MKQKLLPFFLLVAGLFAAGNAQAGVYVRFGPPPLRVEHCGPPPGPGFLWVDGYWAWRGRAYAWAPGYWSRVPRYRSAWVPGRWVWTPRGYFWQRGYWR